MENLPQFNLLHDRIMSAKTWIDYKCRTVSNHFEFNAISFHTYDLFQHSVQSSAVIKWGCIYRFILRSRNFNRLSRPSGLLFESMRLCIRVNGKISIHFVVNIWIFIKNHFSATVSFRSFEK